MKMTAALLHSTKDKQNAIVRFLVSKCMRGQRSIDGWQVWIELLAVMKGV
jgi:hypothetical protein